MAKHDRKSAKKYWKKVTRPKREPVPASAVLPTVLEQAVWITGHELDGQKQADALQEAVADFQANSPKQPIWYKPRPKLR